jgi:hypothetical protein
MFVTAHEDGHIWVWTVENPMLENGDVVQAFPTGARTTPQPEVIVKHRRSHQLVDVVRRVIGLNSIDSSRSHGDANAPEDSQRRWELVDNALPPSSTVVNVASIAASTAPSSPLRTSPIPWEAKDTVTAGSDQPYQEITSLQQLEITQRYAGRTLMYGGH